jgi:ABC-type transport system substrate-binding protein
MNLMYDTMIHVGPKGYEPGLALKWSFPDDSTIDLILRKDVKFQDGTPFNAAAVKFSWDRVINNKTMNKIAAISAMTSVETPADDHVIVRLNKPLAADWRDRMLIQATSTAVVSPTAVYAGDADFSAHPIRAGAGPYAFESYAINQKISLRKWSGYWNPSAQKLDGIEYIQAAGGAPTVTALAGGAADIAFLKGVDINAAKQGGLIIREVVPQETFIGFYFCTSKPPFNNLEARKAVAYALNRNDFVTTAFGGHAKASSQFFPVTSPFYGTNVADPYPFNIAKAKAALAAAGVAPGTSISVLADSSSVNLAVMQTLQDQLKAIGLNLDVKPSPNAYSDLRNVFPHIYYQGAGGNYVAQASFLLPGGPGNYCKLDNPVINASWAKTRDVSLDGAGLKTAWANFQKTAYDEVPFFVVANPTIGIAHTSKVTGVDALELDPSLGYPGAWVTIGMTK